jgi:poly-beta-1,6-N-acetyl-D-glucosamine synthase
MIEFIFYTASIFLLASYPGQLVLNALLRHDPDWKKDDNYTPFISILLAAHNEESVIREKIESTLAIDYPADSFEMVIVSDQSDDQTNAIIQSYDDPRIRLVDYGERLGKTLILNRTVPELKGDIVVMTDANVFFNKPSLRAMSRWFTDTRIGSVCGYEKRSAPKQAKAVQSESTYRKFEVLVKELQGRYGLVLGAHGGIYAFRKSLWQPLPEDSIGDDLMTALNILKQGKAVILDKDAIGYEETGSRVANEFRRRIRIGICNYQSVAAHTWLMNPLSGLVSLFFWTHKLPRWYTPHLMLMLLASSFLLAQGGHSLALFVLVVQFVFYLIAVLGMVANQFGGLSGFWLAPFHFVSMNTALFIGFFKWLGGIKTSTWKPSDRS